MISRYTPNYQATTAVNVNFFFSYIEWKFNTHRTQPNGTEQYNWLINYAETYFNYIYVTHSTENQPHWTLIKIGFSSIWIIWAKKKEDNNSIELQTEKSYWFTHTIRILYMRTHLDKVQCTAFDMFFFSFFMCVRPCSLSSPFQWKVSACVVDIKET